MSIPPPLPRPPVPELTHVLDIVARLEPAIAQGITPWGDRSRVPIIGGYLRGPDIEATIVGGGVDRQLIRADGYIEMSASYFAETDDGVSIEIRNRGLLHLPSAGEPFVYAMTAPRFRAPLGRYAALNRSLFVGTAIPDDPIDTRMVQISVYRLA